MLLLGKIMILQGVGHPISCLGVCYANDPKKGGYMTPAPALDLTTSLRGDFVAFLNSVLRPTVLLLGTSSTVERLMTIDDRLSSWGLWGTAAAA